MSNMLDSFKPLVRRAVLRGPVLAAWHLRQCRRLDEAYCRELVRSAAQPVVPGPKVLFAPARPVRTILLIADIMWENNELVPELRKLAEVAVLDLHPALAEKPMGHSPAQVVADMVKDFADAQTRLDADVILFYARGSILSEEVFHHLRRRWKCPLFGMNLDDKATFFSYGIFSAADDNYQRWAGRFDLNLTNTFAAVDWYHQRGLPCLYSPQGVNLPADLPPPGPRADFEYPFTFVGSARLERRAIVDRLLQCNIPLTLFGAGWPNSRWVDSPTRIYRSSQINLGIGLCTATETQTTVKGRDFECPGVGACYLTTYNWELVNHYEMGKEILCYRSVEELIEMYSHYRKRPEDCLRIAQAAYRRSAAEHTWEQRFRKIFRETGLRLPAG
jgi:hypothetical protein